MRSFSRVLMVGCLLVALPALAEQNPVTVQTVEATADAPPPKAPKEAPASEPEPAAAVVAKKSEEAPADEMVGAALLFNLNNVFTSGAILDEHRGYGFGYLLDLGEVWGLRLGLDVTRITNPVRVERVTTITGNTTVTDYQLTISGPTDYFGASVGADLVRRLSRRKVAPFAGVGLFVDMSHSALRYTDDVSVTDQVTQVNDRTSSWGVGLEGLAGISWRVHESFSLYAEYTLGLTVFRWTSVRGETTIENSAGGTPTTTRSETEAITTRWLNLGLGLGQGASLGVMAHF
ncbi:MAG: outer membrane beta-barrel protein [Deltaproteobacteria bacterium]|nr:outer membrane beta-barrel protein [Deltaproteobacteria bacterium]